MFFRDTAGHNHIAHSLLTILSLGGSRQELLARYEDGTPIQRPIPAIDHALLSALSTPETFLATLGQTTQYHTFLAFFKALISTQGHESVLQEYIFARTSLADKMLARMYEGAYHPIIHLGLGIEFRLPALIAEALAQAAAHDDSTISTLFQAAERASPPPKPKALLQLLHEVRASEAIRTAPRWTDFGNKMRDGVIGRASAAMAGLAAQFRVQEDEGELRRRTAEMVSVAAFMAGAAQREGRKRKIDFFYMHCVTSSLFFSVLGRQPWIALADRVRLVEWKARLDLAWYAVCGCAPLDADAVARYESPEGGEVGWEQLFERVRAEHDDGHAGKFIRALKSGESVAREWEGGEWEECFPMKGDMWLRLARMCQDTTKGLPTDLKWVPFTGFDQPWVRPDLAT